MYNSTEDPPYRVVEFEYPYSVKKLAFCEAAIKAKGCRLQYNPDPDRLQSRKIMTTIKFNLSCIVQGCPGDQETARLIL